MLSMVTGSRETLRGYLHLAAGYNYGHVDLVKPSFVCFAIAPLHVPLYPVENHRNSFHYLVGQWHVKNSGER